MSIIKLYTFEMPRVSKIELEPITPNETIGQRIQKYRKAAQLTQQELSQKIGIDRGLVSDYERGRIRLYDEMVARFALALGVHADDLLGIGKDSKNSISELESIDIRWLKRIREIKELPELKQKEIIRNINTVLENYRLKQEKI